MILPVCVSFYCKISEGILLLGMLDYKLVNAAQVENTAQLVFPVLCEYLYIYCHISCLADTRHELGCRLELAVLTDCCQAF